MVGEGLTKVGESARFDFRHGDAMELLHSLPDKSVDATITDPPYGTTDLDWDAAPDWSALMAELLRVTKGAVCVFSQMPVAVDVVNAARKFFRYQWVWRKSLVLGFLDANRKPMRVHELVLVFGEHLPPYHPQLTKGEPYVRTHEANRTKAYGEHRFSITENEGTRNPVDVLEVPNERGPHHTQKPTELIRYLVRTYTDRGGVVLDPYAGSGTAGVACALEDRRFVGSELDDAIYSQAIERVMFAFSQGRLFEEV